MHKRVTLILAVMLALVILFIWGNSVLPKSLSAMISGAVGNFMASILGEGDASTTVGGFSVRKLAHLLEYFALGVLLPMFFAGFIGSRALRLTLTVSSGVAIPLIDETIQILSSRGPSIVDIWIDVAGFSVGCAAVYLAFYIQKKISLKSEKRQ